MTYTNNFNLKIIDGQDPPDIEIVNQNMETIDNELYKISTKVESGDDIEEEE